MCHKGLVTSLYVLFCVLLWVNHGVFSPSVLLWVFLSRYLCCLSIRFFFYILFVPIFSSKLFCFFVIRCCMSSCIFPLLFDRIFLAVLFCLYCFILIAVFLVFLLSPLSSGLFPLVELFVFCPDMFKYSHPVLSFLLVVLDFLSAFRVEFPIQAFSFCSYFLGEHRFFLKLITLPQGLDHLMFFVQICANTSFIFFSFCLYCSPVLFS